MTIRSANLGPTASSAVMATQAVRLHAVHWSSSTAGKGTVSLRDGLTPTATTVRIVIDTPVAGPADGVAGDLPIPGGGLKFNTALSAAKTNTGGVTIIYDDTP